MNLTNQSLIHLEGIKKVFMTDEVETYALADVHRRANCGGQQPIVTSLDRLNPRIVMRDARGVAEKICNPKS